MSDDVAPESAADVLEHHATGDGRGVTHDTLLDAAAEANAAANDLRSMYVDLDGICDNLGVYPDSVQADLRSLQSTVHDEMEWMETFAQELEDRREEHAPTGGDDA